MRTRGLLPTFATASVPWLLEGLLIVVSVVLGMWVTQIQQARSDRELARTVLGNIAQEVEHNLASLEPYVAVHADWVGALAKATGEDDAQTRRSQAGIDVLTATRPRLPRDAKAPFPFLRRSAWDAALAGGSIRLIDHEVAAALSDIYRMQEILSDNMQRLANGVFTSVAVFDPAHQRASVRLLAVTLEDIRSTEATVLDLYRTHLPAIRTALDIRAAE